MVQNMRAKFRVMGVERRWDKVHNVELAPVYDDGSDENASWSKYTPSGSAKLITGAECPFVAGEYTLIDFEFLEGEDGHTLEGNMHRLYELVDNGQDLVAKFTSVWNSDREIRRSLIEMTITNEKLFPLIRGGVGKVWRVAYTPI